MVMGVVVDGGEFLGGKSRDASGVLRRDSGVVDGGTIGGSRRGSEGQVRRFWCLMKELIVSH